MASKHKTNFREYNQGQGMLFPPYLEELIPEDHLVRSVNDIIDHLNPKRLYDRFKDERNPAYHPKMMLKVLIYAYCIKIYTCRKIARALRQDVTFMWLSGTQRPDYITVNRFRSDYLKDVLEDVFSEVLVFLYNHGYIRFEDYYVDGSKIEANANKHSHVWKKNVERYKSAVKKRVKGLLKEIEELNKQEDLEYGEKDLEELGQESQITSEKIKKVAAKINKTLEKKGSDDIKKKNKRKIKSCINKLKKETEKLASYEEREVKKATGYLAKIRHYECEDCNGCPLKSKCTTSKTNRTISVNRKLEAYKEKMRVNLNSEKGLYLRKRRGIEVETFLADLKYNQEFRRFFLRGLEKVNTELGWLGISYNLRKVHRMVVANNMAA